MSETVGELFVDNVPTEADWRSEPWNLDTEYAHKRFAGKSLDEAIELFRQNSLTHQEDVMFMPLLCFKFYVHAYIAYLRSRQSRDDADGASCFFGLVKIRREEIRKDKKLADVVAETLAHLAERQEYYDATRKIYGDFGKHAHAMLKVIGR